MSKEIIDDNEIVNDNEMIGDITLSLQHKTLVVKKTLAIIELR